MAGVQLVVQGQQVDGGNDLAVSLQEVRALVLLVSGAIKIIKTSS